MSFPHETPRIVNTPSLDTAFSDIYFSALKELETLKGSALTENDEKSLENLMLTILDYIPLCKDWNEYLESILSIILGICNIMYPEDDNRTIIEAELSKIATESYTPKLNERLIQEAENYTRSNK